MLTLVTYVNAFVPILPVPARRDPAARAAGWDVLAARVDTLRSTVRERTYVGADRYQEASELALHLRDHPTTFALNLSEWSRANQYDLWPSFPDRAQRGDALILVVDDVAGDGMHPTAALLAPHFVTITKSELVPLARGGDVVKNLRIWLLRDWRGTWPQAPLRSRS
jgi:hypothetical protein